MSEPRPVPPRPVTPARDAAAPSAGLAPRISSATLFGNALEVQIDHHGAIYRLKQTALGKLILTK